MQKIAFQSTSSDVFTNDKKREASRRAAPICESSCGCEAVFHMAVFMSSDGCEGGTEASTCRPDGTGGTGEGGRDGGGGGSGELKSAARVLSKWYFRGGEPPRPPNRQVFVSVMERGGGGCPPAAPPPHLGCHQAGVNLVKSRPMGRLKPVSSLLALCCPGA